MLKVLLMGGKSAGRHVVWPTPHPMHGDVMRVPVPEEMPTSAMYGVAENATFTVEIYTYAPIHTRSMHGESQEHAIATAARVDLNEAIQMMMAAYYRENDDD